MLPQPPRVPLFKEPLSITNLCSITTPRTEPKSLRPKPSIKPNPPTAPVAPFSDALKSLGNLPSLGLIDQKNATIDTSRPTCSLNLMCYRSGNCIASQIRVISEKRCQETSVHFNSSHVYSVILKRYPGVISSDQQLFEALRRVYLEEMCGFWRRYFSLKTLRRLRLLSYAQDSRPVPVPSDEFTMQEVLWAYNHPSSFGPETETEWVEWVFRLRQTDKRHALEFVEGWSGTRIAIVGSIPCVASTLVGVVWSAMGGDVQTAFTVAGFILTVATVLLALLAVISGIDSGNRRD